MGDVGTSKEINKTDAYNSGAGYLASTTGNITGVYDMAGGAGELMASYQDGFVGSSGFTNDTELKTTYKNYIDIYPADSGTTTYSKRKLGDATGEMGPFYQYYDGGESDGSEPLRYHGSWYTDVAYFFRSDQPWIYRGGTSFDGGLAGQFYFWACKGEAEYRRSTRLVLSLTN